MQNDVELLDVLKRKTQQSDDLDFLFGKVFAAQKLNESTISYNNRMVGLRANGMLVYFSQISDEIKNNQIESIRQIPKAGVYLSQTKCLLKKELQFQEITLQFLQCQVFYFDNDSNGYIKYPKSRKPQSWVFKIDNTDIRLDLNRQKTFTRIREPSRKLEKVDEQNLLEQQLQLENEQRKTLFAKMQKEQQDKQKAELESKIQIQQQIEEDIQKKQQEQQKQTQIQQKQQLLQSQFNFRYLSQFEQISMCKDDQDEMLKSELKLFHLINEFNQVCQTICINLCQQTQQLQQYYLENNIQIYIQNENTEINQKFRNNQILSDALLQLKILIKTNLVVPFTCLIYYQSYKFYCVANYQQEDIKNIEDVSQLNTLCHLLNIVPDLNQRVCTLDQGNITEIKKMLSDQYSIAPNSNFLLEVEQFFPKNMRPEVVIEHCPTPLKRSSDQYDQDHVLAQQMIDEELLIKLIIDFQDLKVLPVDSKGLAITLHSYGIKMKYLGKIATESVALHIQQLCIMDMIGRISKQIVREQKDDNYSDIIKDYMNLLFLDSQETQQFWNEIIRNLIIKKFEYDIGLYPVQLPFGGLLNCLEYHLNFSIEKSVQLQNKFIINQFKLTIRSKIYEFKSTKLQMIAKENTKVGLSVRLSLEQILLNGQSTIATNSDASIFETNRKYGIEMIQKALQQDQKNKLNIFQIVPLQMLLKFTKDFIYFDESLQIIEYQLGLFHPLNASIYLTAAQIYTQQGKTQDSLILLQSSLNALQKNFGNTHKMIGLVQFEIASLYEQQNQYCESIRLYEECIKNFTDGGMIDQIYLKMGRLYLSFLDYHKAITCIEKIKEQNQESLFIGSICEEKLQKDTKYSEQLFSEIKQNMKQEINQDYYQQCIISIFSHQIQLQDEKVKKYLLKLYYCLKDSQIVIDLEYQQLVILNHVENLNVLFNSMFMVFKGYEGQLYYNKQLYSDFNFVVETIKDEQLHKSLRFFNYFIQLLQENLLEYIQ